MSQFELIHKMINFINLERDVDNFDKIHESIEKDINFKGTNLWILIFAIIVASVGLNMNSTAVIIGAMLISPLMGPIIGMGYSIATYDFPLFRKAIKNFSFAVIASLLASTAYFVLSPISTAHSELLARTSPTIYDVIIALFGGLAGIVALSSKNKGNVIPGVAIATALMPPLCTAGYGIATGQFSYFLGAIYLFTINTVFIAISTIVISQVLKFPIRSLIDIQQRKKVNRWISIITILVILPSIYFGYVLVQKEKFIKNATNFLNTIGVFEGHYLLKSEIKPAKKTLVLVYAGTSLTENQKKTIRERGNYFSLNDAKIEFPLALPVEEQNTKNTEGDILRTEINRLAILLKTNENQRDSLEKKNSLGKQILSEIKTFYPQIMSCSYTETLEFNDRDSIAVKMAVVILTIRGNRISNSEKSKIEKWLAKKMKISKIKVFLSPDLH